MGWNPVPLLPAPHQASGICGLIYKPVLTNFVWKDLVYPSKIEGFFMSPGVVDGAIVDMEG